MKCLQMSCKKHEHYENVGFLILDRQRPTKIRKIIKTLPKIILVDIFFGKVTLPQITFMVV